MRTVADFSRFMTFLKRRYTKKFVIDPVSDDLNRILAEHPRLVVAMNHGPMAGPLAGSIAIMEGYRTRGGTERKPVIIAWRGFYRIPLIRHLVSFMSQVRKPPNLDGFVRKLTDEGFTDLFVMPEGENCSFGNGLDIEPFLSPRFVELALKAEAPVLIAVHVGSHLWSHLIPVDERLDPLLRNLPKKSFERIQATRRVNVSPIRLRTIPELRVAFKLYTPQMTLADLQAPDSHERLQQESDRIHDLMQDLVSGLAQRAGYREDAFRQPA